MNNRVKTVIHSIIVSFSFLMLVGEVQATIYKCVNLQGNTYYNDKPCPRIDDETKFKAVKDPVNGYIPPAFVKDIQKAKANGVVVGESLMTQQNLLSKDKSKSEGQFGVQSSAGGSSANNNVVSSATKQSQNYQNSNSNSTSGIRGTSTRRNLKQLAGGTPLPVVPLNVETNAKEPRSKVY